MSTIDDEIKVIGPRKRSVIIHGKATSIYIADRDWRELQNIADAAGVSAARIVTIVKASNPKNLTRAIKMYIINHRARKYGGG